MREAPWTGLPGPSMLSGSEQEAQLAGCSRGRGGEAGSPVGTTAGSLSVTPTG